MVELKTVYYVDLSRYAGKWYEIARFPQRFEKDCTCTTAVYTLEGDHVIVENRCNRQNGKRTYIKGKAFVEKGSGNSKLKVQFFWPFKGKYWIIELAKDYSYAMVGHPNRKYLWILSRTPQMENDIYNTLVEKAREKRFDVSQLKLTEQNCNE